MPPFARDRDRDATTANGAPDFERHRRHLAGLAYRMLGSVAESEDVVQDAYLRWHAADRGAIDNPKAYLTTVIMRLALDRARSAQRRREIYVGPWLPERVVEAAPPAEAVAGDASFALMLALERLSPLERAAFLLHDVFDLDFDEVAAALGRSTAACRQFASRARGRVRSARPRFEVDADESRRVADAFFAASRSGDTAALRELLAEAVALHSDGGGRRRAMLRVLTGVDRVSRLFLYIARNGARATARWFRLVAINGLPGWLTVEADGALQATAVEIEDGRIAAIYIVRNPDKLAHLASWVPESLRTPAA